MKVFYFWETKPGATFPAYLDLCIETWRRNIPGAEVVHVTHANLAGLCGGRVDVERLKAFTLPLQSDIAAVAVMAEHPGMFLDADTLILPGFRPEGYQDAWLTMYGDPSLQVGLHATNFFFTSRPENPVLAAWLDEANRRIMAQTSGLTAMKWALRKALRGKPPRVGWNYLGNGILDPLLAAREHADAIDLRDLHGRGYGQTDAFSDRYAHVNGYVDFWYDPDIPVDEVLAGALDNAVGLQHSWTPDWYSALDRDGVMADPSLISRMIRTALGELPNGA